MGAPGTPAFSTPACSHDQPSSVTASRVAENQLSLHVWRALQPIWSAEGLILWWVPALLCSRVALLLSFRVGHCRGCCCICLQEVHERSSRCVAQASCSAALERGALRGMGGMIRLLPLDCSPLDTPQLFLYAVFHSLSFTCDGAGNVYISRHVAVIVYLEL